MRSKVDRLEEAQMRYLVERTFPQGLHIAPGPEGANVLHGIVSRNESEGVTWLHSYVSQDKRKTFCIYDGPTPEAIRLVAERNGLPVDVITQVSVLDPYYYH